MNIAAKKKCGGFTLIEIAIVLGVMGALLLVVATLMTGTIDAYAKIASKSDSIKQARQCLEIISRDLRESVNFDIQSTADGGALANVTDAMLLTSARGYDTLNDLDDQFYVDVDDFPDPQSITLYYINTTAEGIPQLVRHRLYYTQDLTPLYTAPFELMNPPGPYVGDDIVIRDSLGNLAFIDRSTGAIGATPPFRPPRVLMNGSVSLDIIDNGLDPIESRITCQFTDRNGRSETTRLRTQVEPRNM